MKEIKKFTAVVGRRQQPLTAVIRTAKIGKVYVLQKNVDFLDDPRKRRSARSAVYVIARCAGLKAKTAVVNGNIEFSFTAKKRVKNYGEC